MLKKLFKTHGRHRPDELITALLALSPSELVQNLAKLFVAGELRFGRRRRGQTARKMCSNFYRYHENNPQIADWFLSAARSLQKEQHRDRYSISALTERIRWDIRTGVIKTDGGFKISNNVRACYARLVVMRDPSLCGLFEVNPSKVDDLLVIDGRSWAEFAKVHCGELWPERNAEPQRKPQASVRLEQTKEQQG